MLAYKFIDSLLKNLAKNGTVGLAVNAGHSPKTTQDLLAYSARELPIRAVDLSSTISKAYVRLISPPPVSLQFSGFKIYGLVRISIEYYPKKLHDWRVDATKLVDKVRVI